jgi:hypothetical protein
MNRCGSAAIASTVVVGSGAATSAFRSDCVDVRGAHPLTAAATSTAQLASAARGHGNAREMRNAHDDRRRQGDMR